MMSWAELSWGFLLFFFFFFFSAEILRPSSFLPQRTETVSLLPAAALHIIYGGTAAAAAVAVAAKQKQSQAHTPSHEIRANERRKRGLSLWFSSSFGRRVVLEMRVCLWKVAQWLSQETIIVSFVILLFPFFSFDNSSYEVLWCFAIHILPMFCCCCYSRTHTVNLIT